MGVLGGVLEDVPATCSPTGMPIDEQHSNDGERNQAYEHGEGADDLLPEEGNEPDTESYRTGNQEEEPRVRGRGVLVGSVDGVLCIHADILADG